MVDAVGPISKPGEVNITLSRAFSMHGYNKKEPINFVGKQLTIFGQSATLDAKGAGSLFQAIAGSPSYLSSLELHEITLMNCNGGSRGGGGAISAFWADVKIYNAIFERNKAGAYPAGAISVVDCTLLIRDTKFFANSGYQGGAIAAFLTNASIYTSTFESNQAETLTGSLAQGGAMYISSGALEVHGTVFKTNAAKDGGGAIAAFGAAITICTSDFITNSVSEDYYGGGAIFVTGGTGTGSIVRIASSQFVKGINPSATHNDITKEGSCPPPPPPLQPISPTRLSLPLNRAHALSPPPRPPPLLQRLGSVSSTVPLNSSAQLVPLVPRLRCRRPNSACWSSRLPRVSSAAHQSRSADQRPTHTAH
jgi:hypothetical protein